MSNDLLAKEKEFYRLNKELEQKTRDLMKEVDSVINSHGMSTIIHNTTVFNRSHLNASLKNKEVNAIETNNYENYHNYIKYTTPKKKNLSLIQHPFRQKTNTEISNTDEIFSGHDSENETATKFFKTKIKILHEELCTVKLEYVKQCNIYKNLETKCKKLEESKKKLYNHVLSLKETVSKLEIANANCKTKIEEQNIEITTLKKETDNIKKELRTSNQQSASLDIRFQRSLEDNEKLRNALKFNQLEEKELRVQIRKLQNNRTTEIKILEKQRAELFLALKKQMHLVDNLKKQKAYLEASKQMQLTETDFLKLLELEPE